MAKWNNPHAMQKRDNADLLSRRAFSALVASATAASTFAQQSKTSLVPDTAAFESPLEFTRQDVVPQVEPFPMQHVRLLPASIYFEAREWNRGYMARLPADRLLYTFRVKSRTHDVGIYRPRHRWSFSGEISFVDSSGIGRRDSQE